MELTEKSNLFIYRQPIESDLPVLEDIQQILKFNEPRIKIHAPAVLHNSLIQGGVTHRLSNEAISRISNALPERADKELTMQVRAFKMIQCGALRNFIISFEQNSEYDEAGFFLKHMRQVGHVRMRRREQHITLAHINRYFGSEREVLEGISTVVPETITFKPLEVLTRFALDEVMPEHVATARPRNEEQVIITRHRPGTFPSAFRDLLHASLPREVSMPPMAVGE